MKKLIVRFVLLYLRFFARLAVRINHPYVIGITGSSGKTSTRDTLYAALKDHKRTYKIVKGNSETGVPLGLLGLKVHSLGFQSIHKSIKDWVILLIRAPFQIFYLHSYAFVIVEMGVDSPHRPQNMEYLLDIVQPTISVFLNVQSVHGETYERVIEGKVTKEKVLAAIAHEKGKFITQNSQCRLAVVNADDPQIQEIVAPFSKDKKDSIQVLTFGKNKDATIQYKSYTVSTKGSHFTLIGPDGKTISVHIKEFVLPEVFQSSIAASLLIGMHLGMKSTTVAKNIEQNFSTEEGRSSVLQGINDSILLDSSYNASVESMKSMIELAQRLATSEKRKGVLLIGDMREIGINTGREHTSLHDYILDFADYVYTVGPLTKKHIYAKLKDSHRFKDIKAFDTPHDAGNYLKKNMPKHSLLLVKGSQNTIFLEEAIKYLLLNPEDVSRLPRQEDYWMRVKQFSIGHFNAKA